VRLYQWWLRSWRYVSGFLVLSGIFMLIRDSIKVFLR